jgi:hypothetical protein
LKSVAPAERDDAALAEEAVELERLELQLFELLEQPALLVPGEELGLIPEAGRKIGHF